MPFNAEKWRATHSMKRQHLFKQSKPQLDLVWIGSLCGAYLFQKQELDHYRIDLFELIDLLRCKNCLRVQLARKRRNEK